VQEGRDDLHARGTDERRGILLAVCVRRERGAGRDEDPPGEYDGGETIDDDLAATVAWKLSRTAFAPGASGFAISCRSAS